MMRGGVTDGQGGIWREYLEEFSYFPEAGLRPGCHPRTYLHEKKADRALVLVHGLTDSPYCMDDLARFFYRELGYDVYLPLLQGHGLLEPGGMEDVRLKEWKRNVDFARSLAVRSGQRLSMGGLSTGGALVLANWLADEFSGNMYLFSAALGLYGGPGNLFGGVVEWLLRSRAGSLLPEPKNGLVGDNPGRYDRVPYCSAGELCRLIREIQENLERKRKAGERLSLRLFIAMSEADRVISVKRLKKLRELVSPGKYSEVVLPRKIGVPHASVVLETPIHSTRNGEVLEHANPRFREMCEGMTRFGLY